MSDITPPIITPPAAEPAQPSQQAAAPAPVPYERFKEVNDQFQALKAQIDQITADKKKADEGKLAEEGKFKDLLATRERELADERAARVRLSVAAKKGLVGELAPLADRLRGATEAELEADADTLLAFARKPAGLGVPPPGSGGRPAGQLDLNSMTPAQIREARAKGQIK